VQRHLCLGLHNHLGHILEIVAQLFRHTPEADGCEEIDCKAHVPGVVAREQPCGVYGIGVRV
jgi:hypothetical protein